MLREEEGEKGRGRRGGGEGEGERGRGRGRGGGGEGEGEKGRGEGEGEGEKERGRRGGFDFIECFTTTFLRAHSWLNWVGEKGRGRRGEVLGRGRERGRRRQEKREEEFIEPGGPSPWSWTVNTVTIPWISRLRVEYLPQCGQPLYGSPGQRAPLLDYSPTREAHAFSEITKVITYN